MRRDVFYSTDPAIGEPGFYTITDGAYVLVEAHTSRPNTSLDARMVVTTGMNKEK